MRGRRIGLPGGRTFHLRLWPTLLMLLVLPALLGLGFWQLGRAEDKRALLDARAARLQAPALGVGELLQTADPRHRLVRLQGRFDVEHALLLDHRSRHGQPGVEVLQPFYDEPSGRWLLVNRGWLPWPDRRVKPPIATPPDEVVLSARVHQPSHGPLPFASAREDDWPRVIHRLEAERIWALLGRSGVGYELRQESGPGAFDAVWPSQTLQPASHIGYALQWFAMAAGVFGLWLFLGLHRRAPPIGPLADSTTLKSRP